VECAGSRDERVHQRPQSRLQDSATVPQKDELFAPPDFKSCLFLSGSLELQTLDTISRLLPMNILGSRQNAKKPKKQFCMGAQKVLITLYRFPIHFSGLSKISKKSALYGAKKIKLPKTIPNHSQPIPERLATLIWC